MFMRHSHQMRIPLLYVDPFHPTLSNLRCSHFVSFCFTHGLHESNDLLLRMTGTRVRFSEICEDRMVETFSNGYLVSKRFLGCRKLQFSFIPVHKCSKPNSGLELPVLNSPMSCFFSSRLFCYHHVICQRVSSHRYSFSTHAMVGFSVPFSLLYFCAERYQVRMM